MREAVYRGYVGLPTGGGLLSLPTLNCVDMIVELMKVDAETATGKVTAIAYLYKDFQYVNLLMQSSFPQPFYFFPWQPPDGGATAHELVRSLPLVVTLGTGGGVVAGDIGNNIYHGKYGVLDGRSLITATTPTLPIFDQEINGLPWTLSFWLYRQVNAVAGIYFEGNASLSTFVTFTTTAAGQIAMGNQAGTVWTSTAAIPALSTWHHHMIAYDGANMRHFIDGALVSGPTARAHGAGAGGDTLQINRNASNVLVIGLLAVHATALSVGEAYAMYQDIVFTGANGAVAVTPATITQNASVLVVMNNSAPQGLIGSTVLGMPLSPIIEIVTANGVFYYQARLRFREGGNT